MSNKKFMVKCIMALMLCLIGLASCGDKVPANEIHYTTIDNSVLPIKNLFHFGEGRIISNSYNPEKNVCILKLDQDVTEIGKETFCACSSLTSITIPPSVKEIGYEAFAWCSSLTNISVSKDNKVYDSREDCNAIIHTESNTLIRGCKNTMIPASVTKIGDLAFCGCKSLTSITIPPSVTKIGDAAFADCKSLTSISIPPSVKEIGYEAFEGCESLTSITIPPSVTKIGGWAFYDCSSLTEVRIPKDCNVDVFAFDFSPNVQIIRY